MAPESVRAPLRLLGTKQRVRVCAGLRSGLVNDPTAAIKTALRAAHRSGPHALSPADQGFYVTRRISESKTKTEILRCLIGGVSGPRSGSRSGRGSSVASGNGLVAEPLDGQFVYGHLRRAEAPGPALGDMPDRGPNNEEPAQGLDTAESTTDSERRPG